MQYVVRFNLKPFTASEFQEWLKQNESKIKENQPDGWHFLGTWFTVRGFGKFDCESRWEIDDYDALGAGFGNETLQKLNKEFFEEFIDLAGDSETYLMKSAEEVRIAEGL